MRKIDFGALFFVLLIALVFVAGCLFAVHESKVAKENYNNGICTNCGGEYCFTSSEHIKNSGDRYYYACEDCGHTVMTYSIEK